MKTKSNTDTNAHTVEEYNKKHKNQLPQIVGEKVILDMIPDSNEFYELYLEWISNEDLMKAADCHEASGLVPENCDIRSVTVEELPSLV